MKTFFIDNNLALTDENFLNVLSTMICRKYSMDIDTLNKLLGESYEQVSCPEIETDLMGLYDQFMHESQREHTGSFYTPRELAERIVRMSFYDYFKGSDFESDFFYDPVSKCDEALYDELRMLKIADIACGTGVFILATIDVLCEYYNALGKKCSMKEVVDQVYGFDVQEMPLKILKLFLMEKFLVRDESVGHFHLKCVDTITHESDEKFHIIVGNPPYVGEKGNKQLFDRYKHLSSYEGRMDLFYFFIYKGYEWLKDKGVLGFITTNYFITADGANKLRSFLKNEVAFKRIINMDECKMFSEAKGMHNLIFTFTKASSEMVDVLILNQKKIKDMDLLYKTDYSLKQHHLFADTGNLILYEKTEYYSIIEKMLTGTFQTLDQVVNINQGIVSGADKVSKSVLQKKLNPKTVASNDIQENDPIYVFEKRILSSDYLKPFYKNSEITPYQMSLNEKRWILYVNNGDLEEHQDEYQHLLKFKELLEKRREVVQGRRDWYALQWGRSAPIFESEKIVVPQRAAKNIFGYTKGPFYGSADIYFLTDGPLKYLLGILNSKLYYFWLYNRGKRKGQSLELYAKPLSQIPIPLMDYSIIETYVEDIMAGVDKRDDIDQVLYKFFCLTPDEIKIVENLYNRGAHEQKNY